MTVALVLLTAACGADDAEEATASGGGDIGQTELVVFHDRDHFVGDVTDELFVAVTAPRTADSAEAQTVTGYLCDGEEIAEWFHAEAARGETVEVDVTDEIHVAFTMTDEDVAGTVTVADDEQPFTAEPARGGAGLVRLETRADVDGEQHLGVSGWITLDDGRQQGLPCFPGSPFWPRCAELT